MVRVALCVEGSSRPPLEEPLELLIQERDDVTAAEDVVVVVVVGLLLEWYRDPGGESYTFEVRPAPVMEEEEVPVEAPYVLPPPDTGEV